MVISVLVVGGWLVGVSPARWLLPCLAFTAGALALGEVVGLQRASTGLALGWAFRDGQFDNFQPGQSNVHRWAVPFA